MQKAICIPTVLSDLSGGGIYIAESPIIKFTPFDSNGRFQFSSVDDQMWERGVYVSVYVCVIDVCVLWYHSDMMPRRCLMISRNKDGRFYKEVANYFIRNKTAETLVL